MHSEVLADKQGFVDPFGYTSSQINDLMTYFSKQADAIYYAAEGAIMSKSIQTSMEVLENLLPKEYASRN